MDRNHKESVELFRAFTVEEVEQREKEVALGFYGTPWRGDYSSSYND